MPLADQLVQVGHACLEAGQRFELPVEPSHLVVLAVRSSAQLIDALVRLDAAGIRYVVFRERDDDLGYTAACTEPLTGTHRCTFRRYALWHRF